MKHYYLLSINIKSLFLIVHHKNRITKVANKRISRDLWGIICSLSLDSNSIFRYKFIAYSVLLRNLIIHDIMTQLVYMYKLHVENKKWP